MPRPVARRGGLKTSYLRLKAYPFTRDLGAFIDAHDRVYVVEQNRDAQMAALIRMDLDPARLAKIRSVLHYNGLPIDARSVTDAILAQEGLAVAHASRRDWTSTPHACRSWRRMNQHPEDSQTSELE